MCKLMGRTNKKNVPSCFINQQQESLFVLGVLPICWRPKGALEVECYDIICFQSKSAYYNFLARMMNSHLPFQTALPTQPLIKQSNMVVSLSALQLAQTVTVGTTQTRIQVVSVARRPTFGATPTCALMGAYGEHNPLHRLTSTTSKCPPIKSCRLNRDHLLDMTEGLFLHLLKLQLMKKTNKTGEISGK